MTNHPLFTAVKQAGDISAVGLIVGSFASWLPSIAAFLSILWFVIRIYDRVRYGPSVQRRGADQD